MKYDLQRASVWKRASAFLLDIILLAILSSGIAFALSAITGYGGKYEAYSANITAVEEKYGVDFRISESSYNELSDEKKADYDAANKELNENAEAVRLLNIMINLSLVIVTASIALGYLILEFFLPMFVFRHGRTVGKKIFGLAVIRNSGVKINGPVLFIRTVLGKYAIETMIAAYIVIMFVFGKADIIMIILFFLIPIVNLILLIATYNHSMIHDLLASTVVIDYASQLIFDSEEDLIEYKKKLHSEAVERAGKER